MKDVLFVLVGSEAVLGGEFCSGLFVCFVFVFLLCLSLVLRRGTTSLRIHLASGWGYFVFPSLVFPYLAVRNTFRGICSF